MELKEKFELKNINLNFSSLRNQLGHFWRKIHTTVFVACLAVVIFFGYRIWQQSLNGEGWSEQRKNEYLKQNDKSVNFKENEFKQVLNDIQARKNYSADSLNSVRNIFAPY